MNTDRRSLVTAAILRRGRTPPGTDRLLTPDEVADLLVISTRTLWRLVKEGRFPEASIRLNRKTVRWRLLTVLDWIEQAETCTAREYALDV